MSKSSAKTSAKPATAKPASAMAQTLATVTATATAVPAQPVKKAPVAIAPNVPAGSAAALCLAAGIATLPASNPANGGAVGKPIAGAALYTLTGHAPKAAHNAVMWQAMQAVPQPATLQALATACGSSAYVTYCLRGKRLVQA